MRIAAVESSIMARVAYEEAASRLHLEFGNFSTYEYFDVPVTVFEALLSAPSKGRYFNQAIRGRFRYRLVPKALATEVQGGCVS